MKNKSIIKFVSLFILAIWTIGELHTDSLVPIVITFVMYYVLFNAFIKFTSRILFGKSRYRA